MTTSLEVTAVERSTFVVRCYFKDENGAPVVPDSAAWTLTDGAAGAPVNGREAVEISSLNSTVDIVLSGDDLQVSGSGRAYERRLTIEATYTSSLGSGLPLRASCSFLVENLVAV